ncbi:hypothetical protein EsH8_IV_000887 [Colletotrichum jinshuiense]
MSGFDTYKVLITTFDVANAICGLGATAMHITNDIRHLAHKSSENPGRQCHPPYEMMLLADAILIGLDNVTSGLIVAKGGSRQEAHEEIRVLSHQASDVVKKQGGKNDLIERIKATEYFKPVWGEIDSLLDPKLFTGRSAEMVERYCGKSGPVQEQLKRYAEYISKSGAAELNV